MNKDYHKVLCDNSGNIGTYNKLQQIDIMEFFLSRHNIVNLVYSALNELSRTEMNWIGQDPLSSSVQLV